MPIPKPKQGEKVSNFVGRCMSDKKMQVEYSDRGQRAAVCYQAYRDKDKKQ